jgi:hypothetical protein
MDSKKQAQGIASLGRYGDTTLMHMRPDEVEQLKAISRAGGGDITINPKTGMPEAFLGNFFSALAPTAAGLAAGAIFPGAPFLAPALAGGATAYLQGKRDPLSIGMGALSGYGGGQLGASLKGFGATKAATPELAGTAELGGGAAGTPVADAGAVGSSIGATGGTTVGQNQFISPFTPTGVTGTQMANPALTSGTMTTAQVNQLQNLQGIPGGLYTGSQGMAQTLANAPGGFQPPLPNEGGGFETPAQYNQRLRDYTGDVSMMQSKNLGSFEQGLDLGKGLAETGKGFGEAVKDPMGYLKYRGDGDAFTGGIKTALPFAGAGAEAYMKGYYEDMPTPESDAMRYYDPTRTLNLGMDTGLRLLAKGGHVKNYVMGGMTQTDPGGYSDSDLSKMAAYGVVPQYKQNQMIGPGGGGPVRVPVQGIVDVGGKFVASPKGDITDVEYIDKYKYILEGPEKQDQDSGDQPFDSQSPMTGGAGGINPAVALQAAQGYAEAQQSDTAETGLGQLRKGGAVKYQQGGQTTAEQNTAKAATPPPATTMDMILAKKNEEEMAKQGIPAGINIEAIKAQAANAGMNEGGIAQLAEATPDDGKMLNGEGDGVSDDIPAMIEGQQEAALSDGEFIVPARIVSELGNGSSDAGAQKLYSMIDRIQAARKQTIGDDKQYAKDTNAERFLPA